MDRVRSRLLAVVVSLATFVTLLPAVGSAAVVDACPSSIPSSGFRDLGGLTSETVDAIDCIAHYGITNGLTTNNFTPFGEVTRWQMALFLVRMADDIGIPVPSSPGLRFDDIRSLPAATQLAINQLAELGIAQGVAPGRFDPNGLVPRWQMALFLTRLHARAGYILPSGSPQGFVDIGTHPVTTQIAVNQLVQLGISRGTSSTTFSPAAIVSRWQMALFLARELQAGGAKPWVITASVQPTSSPTSGQVVATITLRSPSGAPVVGRHIDTWIGTTDSSGRCVLDGDAHIGSGDAATGSNCRIDSNDPRTNSNGQVTLTLTHDNVPEIDTVWAWIGSNNQVFDADEVATLASVQVTWTPQATALFVPSLSLRYGTTATVQGWLVDGQGKIIALAGQRIVLTVQRGGTQILAQALNTAADGRFTFQYVGPADPSSGADDPTVDTVRAFWDRDLDGKDDGAAELDTIATVSWDDDEPKADKAVLTQSSISTLVGQATTLTATVTDKFGTPIPGADVTFTVGGPNGFVQARTTNGSGVATHSYVAVTGAVDTIDASVDTDDDGDVDIQQSAVTDLTHYQVVTAGDLSGTRNYDIVAINLGDNTADVVDLGDGSLYRLRWDSTNDTFTVNGSATSLNGFESALSGLTLPAVGNSVNLRTMPYSSSTSGASTWVLTTS